MLRVTCVHTGGAGAPYYSTFHFEGNSSGEATAGHAAVTSFWTELLEEINTLNNVTVNGEVDVVDALTGLTTGTFVVPATVVDCAGGANLPPSNQGLIRWRTGDFVGGKEIRGKTFIPLVPGEYSAAGIPAPTYLTALQAAADGLLADGAGAGGLTVYSPTHHQTALVTLGNPWTQFAVLRSRRD